MSGRRSYTEVTGLSSQPEEDCFYAYKEPIAKVQRWLKEASAELEKAQKNGKLPVIQAQANNGSVRQKVPTKSHSQSSFVRDSVVLGECNQILGKSMREVGGSSRESRRALAFISQA